MKHILLLLGCLFSMEVWAQSAPDSIPKPAPEKKWYENISLRGYMQVRYNRLLETNPDLKCEQCDRSWGDNGGFFIRRARIIFSGQLSDRVFFYIQPDFAAPANATNLNYLQIRDAYFDVGLDKKSQFKFRIGQSKIPYGFDNMQSSQWRLPLDRSDGINSAQANERDLGVFFYYTPKRIKDIYSGLVKDGLKGSGDYGIVGFGVYNGQLANKPTLNDDPHIVGRLSYPLAAGNQLIEAGVQAYTGRFKLEADQVTSGDKTNFNRTYLDQRIGGTLVLYPKPFGVQAEYNIGRGPEFNKAADSIQVQNLQGGYVTFCYRKKIKGHFITPYSRLQYYDGGKKQEKDARSYTVKEIETGIEWQPVKQLEFTAAYTISNRRFEDYSLQNNVQAGRLLRLQAQVNF